MTDVDYVEQIIEERGLHSLGDADIAEAVLQLQSGEPASEVERRLIDWDADYCLEGFTEGVEATREEAMRY